MASKRIYVWWLAALCLTPAPAAPTARVCAQVEALESFTPQDRAASAYFDRYLIRRREGALHVRFTKRLPLDVGATAQALRRLEDYPRFMSGYERVEVAPGPHGELLAAVRWRPAHSFFVSAFTQEVEVSDGAQGLRLCWRQLEHDDARALGERRRAPRVNQGYWRLERRAGGVVEINHFHAVEPQLPIPAWLYREIVEDSYEETCRRLVEHVRRTP